MANMLRRRPEEIAQVSGRNRQIVGLAFDSDEIVDGADVDDWTSGLKDRGHQSIATHMIVPLRRRSSLRTVENR